ncbi:glycosyltransferase [Candidatus Kuenenbacteria bacterium]|nr:glycosyltransferase [Candidatus Kuenenbacteria bacterium]
MKIKIAGVVTLYKPTSNVIDNIDSYIDDLEILFVVDNSDKKEIDIINILKSKKKIYYIDNHGNQGIANDLNVGAQKAIENGYDWLFTIDADSKVSSKMIPSLVECLSFYDQNNIGIISPIHKNKYGKLSGKIAKNEVSSKILITMTSGNLLNLNAYKKVGPFMEKLFIDFVDNEYCLRLNLNGFLVIQVNNAILEHNLGNQKKYFCFYPTNHPPIRRYYITRNRFFVINLYKKNFPNFYKSEIKKFYRELIGILIAEKDILLKIKVIILGYIDYRNGVFGKKDPQNLNRLSLKQLLINLFQIKKIKH